MMDSEKIDYSSLKPNELKRLITNGDVEAEKEFDKRVFSKEIKTSIVTFEDIAKMYKKIL